MMDRAVASVVVRVSLKVGIVSTVEASEAVSGKPSLGRRGSGRRPWIRGNQRRLLLVPGLIHLGLKNLGIVRIGLSSRRSRSLRRGRI